MEFHGIFHGIPWRIRTSISMEFHGNFSIDFHGKYLHGGLGHFPWNSMENIRAPISMEFHGNFCIDIFHGGLGHFLWNSMEKFHAIPLKLLHRLFHGSPRSFMEFTGIRHLKYPVNQIEYITDFGTHCNIFNQ